MALIAPHSLSTDVEVKNKKTVDRTIQDKECLSSGGKCQVCGRKKLFGFYFGAHICEKCCDAVNFTNLYKNAVKKCKKDHILFEADCNKMPDCIPCRRKYFIKKGLSLAEPFNIAVQTDFDGTRTTMCIQQKSEVLNAVAPELSDISSFRRENSADIHIRDTTHSSFSEKLYQLENCSDELIVTPKNTENNKISKNYSFCANNSICSDLKRKYSLYSEDNSILKCTEVSDNDNVLLQLDFFNTDNNNYTMCYSKCIDYMDVVSPELLLHNAKLLQKNELESRLQKKKHKLHSKFNASKFQGAINPGSVPDKNGDKSADTQKHISIKEHLVESTLQRLSSCHLKTTDKKLKLNDNNYIQNLKVGKKKNLNKTVNSKDLSKSHVFPIRTTVQNDGINSFSMKKVALRQRSKLRQFQTSVPHNSHSDVCDSKNCKFSSFSPKYQSDLLINCNEKLLEKSTSETGEFRYKEAVPEKSILGSGGFCSDEAVLEKCVQSGSDDFHSKETVIENSFASEYSDFHFSPTAENSMMSENNHLCSMSDEGRLTLKNDDTQVDKVSTSSFISELPVFKNKTQPTPLNYSDNEILDYEPELSDDSPLERLILTEDGDLSDSESDIQKDSESDILKHSSDSSLIPTDNCQTSETLILMEEDRLSDAESVLQKYDQNHNHGTSANNNKHEEKDHVNAETYDNALSNKFEKIKTINNDSLISHSSGLNIFKADIVKTSDQRNNFQTCTASCIISDKKKLKSPEISSSGRFSSPLSSSSILPSETCNKNINIVKTSIHEFQHFNLIDCNEDKFESPFKSTSRKRPSGVYPLQPSLDGIRNEEIDFAEKRNVVELASLCDINQSSSIPCCSPDSHKPSNILLKICKTESEKAVALRIKGLYNQGLFSQVIQDLESVSRYVDQTFLKDIIKNLIRCSVVEDNVQLLNCLVKLIEDHHLLHSRFFQEIIVIFKQRKSDQCRNVIWTLFLIGKSKKITLNSLTFRLLYEYFDADITCRWRLIPVLYHAFILCGVNIPFILLKKGFQCIYEMSSSWTQSYRLLTLIQEAVDILRKIGFQNPDFYELKDSAVHIINLAIENNVLKSSECSEILKPIHQPSNCLENEKSLSNDQLQGPDLASLIDACVNNDRWGKLMEIFHQYGVECRNGEVIHYIHNSFSQQKINIGVKFKKFICMLTVDGKNKLENLALYLLCQIGTALMLEAHSNKMYQTAYDILEALHWYNIDYYSMQQPVAPCRDVIVGAAVGIPPWVFVTPSQVALIAVDSCLNVGKIESALTVLDDTQYGLPSPDLVDEVRIQELTLRARLLHRLSVILSDEDRYLNKGGSILCCLLDSFVQDLKDTDIREKMAKDVNFIYNKYIVELLNIENFLLASQLYGYFRQLGCMLDLHPVILRAIFVMYAQNNKEKAQELFDQCRLMGVYAFKQITSFPHNFWIQSYLTEEEILFTLKHFLGQLSLLIQSNKTTSFETRFSLDIKIEEVVLEDSSYVRIVHNTSPSMQDALKRVHKVLEDSLKLEVTPNNFDNIISISPLSVYQYFLKWNNHRAEMNLGRHLIKESTFCTSNVKRTHCFQPNTSFESSLFNSSTHDYSSSLTFKEVEHDSTNISQEQGTSGIPNSSIKVNSLSSELMTRGIHNTITKSNPWSSQLIKSKTQTSEEDHWRSSSVQNKHSEIVNSNIKFQTDKNEIFSIPGSSVNNNLPFISTKSPAIKDKLVEKKSEVSNKKKEYLASKSNAIKDTTSAVIVSDKLHLTTTQTSSPLNQSHSTLDKISHKNTAHTVHNNIQRTSKAVCLKNLSVKSKLDSATFFKSHPSEGLPVNLEVPVQNVSRFSGAEMDDFNKVVQFIQSQLLRFNRKDLSHSQSHNRAIELAHLFISSQEEFVKLEKRTMKLLMEFCAKNCIESKE